MKRALIVAATGGFLNGFLIPDMKLLQEMGYEVHCAANGNSVSTFVPEERFASIGVTFHQIDFSSTSPVSKESLTAYKQYKELLNRYHFDFVHVHTPIPGAIVRIATRRKRKEGCVVVYTTHEPFGFSLLLSFLAMFFYLYAYEPIHAGKGWKNAIVTWYQKFKEDVFFRKLFFLVFVTSLILFRTLLNRQLWMNPLSNVMGGWGIWETVNGEQKLTTECIENVIMMVPFSSVVMWTFGEKIGNGWKKILWESGKIAFIFSISIEMLQLLLRLGTFQLSDIFYNTVGGVLGGLMYCVVMKARKRL